MVDVEFLGLTYKSVDSNEVLEEYFKYVADQKLLYYKNIIHTGGKAGESLWNHIMNLATIIEKLRPLFHLTALEMRCLLLAITVHDINKLDPYKKLPNGKNNRYANAASIKNLEEVLSVLEVTSFFPDWQKEYLYDIKYLVDAHQEMSAQSSGYDQRLIEQCHLAEERLEGPLKYLMKVADVSDNTHTGDHTAYSSMHTRDKLLMHLNAGLNAIGHPRRYRFVGHRIAELRGLKTNVIHHEFVSYMRETYSDEACIDLFYHPEGVDYLLDRRIQFDWSPLTQRAFAKCIDEKFAQMQSKEIVQFIKAKPSGISVDDAAIQSGASIETIFLVMKNITLHKQYRPEWREQRNAFVRNDLTTFMATGEGDPRLKAYVLQLLAEVDLVPVDGEMLKRGEFVMAYRNFLKDHRGESLKLIKQDAWVRVVQLFQPVTEFEALYNLVDPYRRGYFMARDLPDRSLDEMMRDALADLEQLEMQATSITTNRKEKKAVPEVSAQVASEQDGASPVSSGEAYLLDYLERNLQVWDGLIPSATVAQAGPPIRFADSLRRYADAKHQHMQCCYCGSSLKADEWMAIQVPPSIGVQSFSNRLEAGSSRDPKRNVCDVCRTQFILEKLAWRSHRDKQGNDQITFYLHLFPYSFFTQPMLLAWWQSIERLNEGDHTALFLDTKDFFARWHANDPNFQAKIRYFHTSIAGLGIPNYSETISNTPVLPLMVGGKKHGMKFLEAVEKTVALALWFDCRIILSRLPTPLLNLANERLNNEPAALLVENIPQSMSWLLPNNLLTRGDIDELCHKLSGLHRITELLSIRDDQQANALIYDLVVAAADDPLALYFELDRFIERSAAQNKSHASEYQAITLSAQIAPLIEDLIQGEKKHA